MISAKPRWRRWQVPLGMLLLLVLASIACAGGSSDTGNLYLGTNYDLKSGKQIDGDGLIVADRVNLNAGSIVNGNVTLIGKRIELDGDINGDVVAIGERLVIGEQAHIKGDLSVCTDTWQPPATAQIDGQVKKECTSSSRSSAGSLVKSSLNSWKDDFAVRLGSIILGSLMMGAIAGLSMLLFPRPLSRISQSVQKSPLVTGGIGCLTVVIAVGVTVIYGLSLILILPVVLLPFVFVGWAALGVLAIAGWVALADPFGKRVFRLLGTEEHPPIVSAVVGGIALTFLVRIWGLFWPTAWIEALATIILGSMGLGAAVLTRLGTQAFPYSRDSQMTLWKTSLKLEK